MNRLLTEAREAFQVASQLERAGVHKMAYAHGQLAARKIELALAEGWGDRDQLKIDGELVKMPGPDVADSQIDWR